MKKIIKNKVYDTDTAILTATYSSSDDCGSLAHFEESLYRKKTGEFFLFGSGGAMTRYAVSTGLNSWKGGEKIIPLDYSAAQAWAQEHLDTEDYERIFGAVAEEDGSKVRTSLDLLSSTMDRLRRESSKTGKTISSILDSLVAENLK